MSDASNPNNAKKLQIGKQLLDLREQVHDVCKPTRERALAITKIDECMMWLANSEVAS